MHSQIPAAILCRDATMGENREQRKPLDGLSHVPNEALRKGDVPAYGRSIPALTPFGMSFHAYQALGDPGAVTKLAGASLKRFRNEGAVPDSLTDLRACLFFELRRLVHTGEPPSEETWRYFDALTLAIRDRLPE